MYREFTPSNGDRRHDGRGHCDNVPVHYLACAAICQPALRRATYWTLSLVPESCIALPDDVVALDELAPDDGGVAGGVVSEVPDDVDGGALGELDIAELDDESDGGVAGLIVDDDDDDDGEGVTTGGVFVVDGVDDSRLQPATPSTRPAQSIVASALFIAISTGVEKGCCLGRFSRFGAMKARIARADVAKNAQSNQRCRRSTTPISTRAHCVKRPRRARNFNRRLVIITRLAAPRVARPR